MATFEFTYKVPDEPMLNSWDDGNTQTAKYIGDATATLIFDNYEGNLVGSTFTGHDSVGAYPSFETDNIDTEEHQTSDHFDGGDSKTAITVDANDGVKEKLALLIAKAQSGTALEADEEVTVTYTDTAVPGMSGKTYPRANNPAAWHTWSVISTEDGKLDLELKSQQKNTARELEARHRQYHVKWYHDRYDLGASADSDATSYLTTVGNYIAGIDDLCPWMLTSNADIMDISDCPKIPASVATAIGSINDTNYVDWSTTEDGMAEITAPRVFYSEVE